MSSTDSVKPSINYEEAMEILGDMLYEERKEEGLF